MAAVAHAIRFHPTDNVALAGNDGGLYAGSTVVNELGTDLLLRAGASVLFSETAEVRDGIAQVTARAATPQVAQALVREMVGYDAYLQRGGADRSANTAPCNKVGGLSNIIENPPTGSRATRHSVSSAKLIGEARRWARSSRAAAR